MTAIAFYAPLKPPDHPKPSGDRTMARGILAALQDLPTAPRVDLVSRLQTRDGAGDPDTQRRLLTTAQAEIDRLLALKPDWRIWVTYHNYYKAPDLIGPAVARALDIPYVLIEASRSPKRLTGRWADFARRAEAATDAADVVFYMTERDRPALAAARPAAQRLVNLKPFLNRTTLPAPCTDTGNTLLAVGMLRAGDKLDSYRLLAQALPLCKQRWKLHIVGDGPARAEVKQLFAPYGDRVHFTGQLDASQVTDEMTRARVFVWPGVNEAFGMVYLEAQSHGLPVVAQNRAGVRDVIGPAGRLPEPDNLAAFAQAIDTMLCAPLAAATTRDYITQNHLRGATTTLFARELPLPKECP